MLREQVQLVLTDRTALTEGQDFGVLALRTWRLGDLGAKHALLLAGLGWGNMPEEMVEDDLAAGRLVRLQVCEGAGAPLSDRVDPSSRHAAWAGRGMAGGAAGGCMMVATAAAMTEGCAASDTGDQIDAVAVPSARALAAMRVSNVANVAPTRAERWQY